MVYSVYDGEEVDTFLGTIQISKNSKEQTNQIVDGRQRLTTLALLYAVSCRKLNIEPKHKILAILEDDGLLQTIKKVFDVHQPLDPFATIGSKGDITRLTRRGKEDARNAENVYWRNARYIHTLICTDYFKQLNEQRLDKMFETIFFIVVRIEDQEMTQVIRIFDTLNSTGQALSDEAMFKIRYHSYIKEIEPSKDSKVIMDEINDIYGMVARYNLQNENRFIELSMRDVLWCFRTYLIIRYSGEEVFDGSDMMLGTLAFFETLFKKDEACRLSLSLESFRTYVAYHIEYYETFYSHSDLSQIQGSIAAVKRMLPDLLAWTRYSSSWAVPIAFYAFYRFEGNEVPSSYEQSASKSLWLFQLLYFYSVVYQKSIKGVKTSLFKDALIAMRKGDIASFCKERIVQADEGRKKWGYRSFWHCLQYDFYHSYGQAYLLLAVLEAVSLEKKQDFEATLSALFPWERGVKRPQIEHIFAQSLFVASDLSQEEKSEFNGLGNFLLLEEAINKSALKDKHPTIKLYGERGKTFFQGSDMALVETLKNWTSALPSELLDDPSYWLEHVVRVRFAAFKETLISLFPLLSFVE